MSNVFWVAAGAYATIALFSWLALRNLAGDDAPKLHVAGAAILWPVTLAVLVFGG